MKSIKIMNHIQLIQMDEKGQHLIVNVAACGGTTDKLAFMAVLPLIDMASPLDEIDVLIATLGKAKRELAQMMAVGFVRDILDMRDL